MDLTAKQRLELWEKVIGSVVLLEVSYEKLKKGEIKDSNSKTAMFAGVVIDKRTILTCSLGKITSGDVGDKVGKKVENVNDKGDIKPENVGINFITARLNGEDMSVCRKVGARFDNGFLTILKPVDDGVEFTTCAKLGSSRLIQMGLEVFGFCHSTEQEFSFLHGRVSHPKTSTPGIVGISYAKLNNTHASCLGGPVFNSNGILIGIFAFKQEKFDMMIRAGSIDTFLGRWACEEKKGTESLEQTAKKR